MKSNKLKLKKKKLLKNINQRVLLFYMKIKII